MEKFAMNDYTTGLLIGATTTLSGYFMISPDIEKKFAGAFVGGIIVALNYLRPEKNESELVRSSTIGFIVGTITGVFCNK